jgi:hypothetical protein
MARAEKSSATWWGRLSGVLEKCRKVASEWGAEPDPSEWSRPGQVASFRPSEPKPARRVGRAGKVTPTRRWAG